MGTRIKSKRRANASCCLNCSLAGEERKRVLAELKNWVDILTCLGGDLIHKKELLAKIKEMEGK